MIAFVTNVSPVAPTTFPEGGHASFSVMGLARSNNHTCRGRGFSDLFGLSLDSISSSPSESFVGRNIVRPRSHESRESFQPSTSCHRQLSSLDGCFLASLVHRYSFVASEGIR